MKAGLFFIHYAGGVLEYSKMGTVGKCAAMPEAAGIPEDVFTETEGNPSVETNEIIKETVESLA